jgi:hypothetical protein
MRRTSSLLLVFCMCFALCASAQKSKIITFDVPGAGTGAGQGTTPSNVNDAGVISGNYTDSNNVTHSFMRLPF